MVLSKIKIAVGITGKFVIIKGFPNNKKHAGFHDLLKEFEKDDYPNLDLPSGIYKAEIGVVPNNSLNPNYDNTYLYIKAEGLTRVKS